MSVVSFTYTKENGEVSKRDLFALTTPGDKYFGIDITELDLEDQGIFIAEMQQLEQERQAKINALMAKSDLKHKFRSFLPSRMSGITTES